MPSRADLTTRPNRGRRERPDDARHRQRPAERTTPQTRDGRRERTEVTRRRILDATRELILSGSFDPTAQAVAARAGITTRTLFRHFADMRTLHREIILVVEPPRNEWSARPQASRCAASARGRIRHTSRADNKADGRLWARPSGGRRNAPRGVAAA